MAAPIAPGTPIITARQPGFPGGGRSFLTVEFTFFDPAPPTVYAILYGQVNNPGDPATRTSVASTVDPVTQRATADVIDNQQYYIWASATANGQTTLSAPLIFTGAIFATPGTPFLVAKNPDNTYTWNFNTEQIFGPGFGPVYSFVFSPTNNTADPTAQVFPAFVVTPGTQPWQGSVYGYGPATIPVTSPSGTVYIWGQVVNAGTTYYSQFPLRYTVGATGTPPSGPTSGPAGVPPATNTQLSVAFNTTGVTGTLPLTVTCLASTSPTGPFNIACSVQTVSPNNYQATTIDELTPNTTYYFQTTVSNGFLPNQSTVSGPWPTTNVAQVNAPVPTLVQATQITMRFSVPATAFNSAVKTANLRWEAVDTPAVALANAVATTYLGVINSQPTWEGTVYGLTPGRNYYFQGQYLPVGLSTTTGQATEPGNSFDFGYMPPRPWATPNPTIVNGVSQPWRQT